MSETKKILDVAYGTFSCRLEGFDDSVETMKTVVSFFHDLAGHDRFMDIAPQAPDLDALAELTAEQTGTPVEAEVEEDSQKISLRVKTRVIDEPAPQEERPSLRIQRSTDPEISRVSQTEHFANDVTSTQDEEEPEAPEAEEMAFDEVSSDTFEVEQSDAETDDLVEEDVDCSETVDEDDATFEEESEAEAEPVLEAPTESVAAKLQRIRAVVGRDVSPNTDDTYAEDLTEQAQPVTPTAANPLAQRLAELAQRNATLVAEDAQAEAAVDEEEIASEDNLMSGDTLVDDEDEPLTAEELAEFSAEDADEDAELYAETEELLSDDPDYKENVVNETEEAPAPKSDDSYEIHDQVADIERTIALRRERLSKRNELPENVDASISRILTTADQQLNEPENRRHRDAFAQLKAAVAATEAARELGDPGAAPRKPGDDFRDDLDAHEAEVSEAPKRHDVAPLRLVPAQRVDTAEQPSDRTADRLRQIASKMENTGEKDGGFAEFAASQGATELLDLLEAAAAYIAFVEGDEDFSRPQVMKKVQMASASEFSREDGLRSFGRLLRQNRIIKLNNGRFQVSKDTRFRPDSNAAQG